MKSSLYFLLIGVLLCFCKNNRNADQAETPREMEAVSVPAFSSDSAYAFIQKQVDFGPRVPNTKAHKATGDYLIATLERFGANVAVQEFEKEAFDGKKLNLKNIIASYNPDKPKRILLAAHWDTRPFADKDDVDKEKPIDGANDGGSGVGVLLELARLFQKQAPDVGVDIIFFDGEDYGKPTGFKGQIRNGEVYWCLGSQYWSENLHKPAYSAYFGIVLDMVGAKDAKFYREGISMHFAPKVVKRVWQTAHNLGYEDRFISQTTGMITDDHVFINEKAKIPTIDIIEYGPESQQKYFGAYHHTHNDNMNIISKETLQAVGETVLHVVYEE